MPICAHSADVKWEKFVASDAPVLNSHNIDARIRDPCDLWKARAPVSQPL